MQSYQIKIPYCLSDAWSGNFKGPVQGSGFTVKQVKGALQGIFVRVLDRMSGTLLLTFYLISFLVQLYFNSA